MLFTPLRATRLLDWNEVSVDLKDYRYLRYRGPTDSFGNVAEIKFYRNGVKLSGIGFGTPRFVEQSREHF